MPPSQYFKFTTLKAGFENNGKRIIMKPAPVITIKKIKVLSTQGDQPKFYDSIEDIQFLCPVKWTEVDNSLQIDGWHAQIIHMWNKDSKKSKMTISNRGSFGYHIKSGLCVLELIHDKSAQTIRIEMDLQAKEQNAQTHLPTLTNSPNQATDISSTVGEGKLQHPLSLTTTTTSDKTNTTMTHPSHENQTEIDKQNTTPETDLVQNSSPTGVPSSSEETAQSSISQKEISHILSSLDEMIVRLEGSEEFVNSLIEQQNIEIKRQELLLQKIKQIVPQFEAEYLNRSE
jgi:hypothetical protein